MSRPLVDPDLCAVTAALIAAGAQFEELREIHGELPFEPLPGLDDI